MNESITYKIYLEKLTQHLLTVECIIPHPSEGGQLVSLPSWVPGSYLIRDFAKHIVELRAEANGVPLFVEKQTKNTWQCAPCNGALTIRYQVYCFDLAPRGSYVDHSRVFFDGCRVFLVVEGEEEQTRTVEIIPPQHPTCKNWQLATSMRPLRINKNGFGSYVADNHLELIDHPFEISEFKKFEFMVADTPHFLVVSGSAYADWQRLIFDVEKICAGHVNFFGELPRMESYVFLLNVLGKGYGGIEHRSSCTLLCARSDLPMVGAEEMSDEYRGLLGLFSHEYFHLWNVKRIKPEVFINPNLNIEAYTRQLWIFEGITSYFDNLNLVRSQIITSSEYLNILQKDISNFLQNPGSYVQTLEDSSFDAWLKFYQPDENTVNAAVSYYLKGSLVALALDLLIIKNSRRKQSLADVMQVLWQQYGKTGLGVPENYFEHVTYEVTGEDYADFFTLALRTTEMLPLPELLLEVGVIYKTKNVSLLDNLGLKLLPEQQRLQVRSVINGSVLEQAGLAPNDTIVAVNNNAVTINNIENVFKRYATDNIVTLQVFRNDLLIELEMRKPETIRALCELELAHNLSEQHILNQAKWLDR